MDAQLVQRTRYQLQTRVRTAKTCPQLLFAERVGHLLDWIASHRLLSGLIAPLQREREAYATRIATDLAKLRTPAQNEIRGPWTTRSRDDAAALALASLDAIRPLGPVEENVIQGYVVALVAAGYTPGPHRNPDPEEVIEALRDVCIEAVYEYLDEAIDSRNAVVGLLLKYKTRCEMYRRHRLRDAAVNGVEGRTRERSLAFDFYEYLHHQGVDFWVESVTASGEPDVVSPDAGGERLVADAKYIDSRSDVRKTVRSGFRQVFDYCRDHNEPVGYLVIFMNDDVVLKLEGDRDDAFPCFRAGGNTVYYVIIDIHDHGTTASKRPPPREVLVTQGDVVESVEEPAAPSSAPSPRVDG